MAGNATAEQLNKAYAHLAKGEIERAATCFQHIIDNPKDFELYASSIAKQRLVWYCAPLELIVQAMRRTQGPINISLLLKRLCETSEDYNTEEFSNFVKTVELELERGTYSEKIGTNIWIYKDYLEEELSKLQEGLRNSNTPIYLEDYFRKAWKEFNSENPSFPDSNAKVTLSSHIKNKGAEVLDCKIILPNNFIRDYFDSIIEKINFAKKPISLTDHITELLDGPIEKNTQKAIEKYLVLNLDKDLINYSKDFYVTRSLLDLSRLNPEIFDEFNGNENGLTTLDIIQKTFRTSNEFTPTKKIIDIARIKLKENPELIESQQDIWFSKNIFDSHYSKMLRSLEKIDLFFTIDELLKTVTGWETEKVFYRQYKTLMQTKIIESKLVVRVTNDLWMFVNSINAILEDIYLYLANNGPKQLEGILQYIQKKRNTKTILNSFIVFLDKQLKADQRFKNDDSTWAVVNPWEKEHDKIINFFIQNKLLLTIEEMLNLPLVDKNLTAIDKDDRFKKFPNGRWGLSKWVWINDFAYELLFRAQQRLHEIVLIHKICDEKRLSESNVIFLPAEDTRFSQDSLNRWYCRHKLTEEDIDKLLQELARYGGSGRRINQLTSAVLHIEYESTDAEEVLRNDTRFIELEEIWYNRETVFRKITSEEIQEIFEQLNIQPDEQPISTKELGLKYLGCDGRLTNLADLLRRDDRFQEVNLGFWILYTWEPANFVRVPFGGAPAVRSAKDEQEIPDQTVELPSKLTKRGEDNSSKETEQESKNKLYITLGHLDIYYGNIRIPKKLRSWIPEKVEAIRIIDEYESEMIGFIDETKTVLSLKDFIQKRNLSYGDKISIQPGNEPGSLRVTPYGQRNEKVYQEAINHKYIERLIEEAKRVNKSYHDLMIEVMEDMAIPLRSEDIFQLVDYQRTAKRSTISEILSLTECPYEELRYFVNLGNGTWIFDRKRKEAFEMKMKELEEENRKMQEKIADLSHTKEETKNKEKKIKELESQKNDLEKRNKNLYEQIEDLKKEKKEIDTGKENTEKNLAELYAKISSLSNENKMYLDLNRELKLNKTSLEQELSNQKTFIVNHKATEERLKLISNEQNALKEKLGNLEEDIKHLEDTNQNLKNEITSKSDQIEALLKEKEKQLDLLKNYEKIVERQTKKEKARLKELVEAEQEEITEKKNEILQGTENLVQKINQLEKENGILSERILEVEEEASKLKQERLEMIKQKDGEISNYEQLSTRLNKIEKAFSSPIGRFFARILGLKKTI